jgi:hypothetical protein
MDTRFELSHPGEKLVTTQCYHAKCHAIGVHRAPKSRNQLKEYYWFCLDHIREYNKNWNYCIGLDVRRIEREIRNDTVWRRPTWPLNGNSRQSVAGAWFEDNFEILGDIIDSGDSAYTKQSQQPVHSDPEATRALHVMDLTAPITLTALKSRYKDLVKRLHPDTNNGDKSAEDRLKTINEAYATLKKHITR